jgi:plasmid stabilization system protein ParE
MRAVVESIEVMAEVDDAEDQWARFHDAWSTVHWVLSKDPTVGVPIREGGHLRSMVFDGSLAHEMPTIYVVYEITETQIVIQRVSFRDATSSAGRA